MTVEATETAMGAITRACGAIADTHVGPTLQGARTADLLAEILAAATEQQTALDATITQLLETQNELDDQTGT